MTMEEENQRLREQVAQRDARIQQQETQLCQQELLIQQMQAQQELLIQQMQAQIAALTRQVKDLQDRLAKDSHNSSLPPSSDRFGRQPKSLRKKSEKQPGGQEGHPGTTLRFAQAPDEVIEHRVTVCSSCQHDLREVEACVTLRRQVVDIPSPRLIVQEHRAEQKQCPRCQHITRASFPAGVTAPIQYGPLIGAAAV
jgi:transposase